eukprot:7381475-Prymnesium_polylepis.1
MNAGARAEDDGVDRGARRSGRRRPRTDGPLGECSLFDSPKLTPRPIAHKRHAHRRGRPPSITITHPPTTTRTAAPLNPAPPPLTPQPALLDHESRRTA